MPARDGTGPWGMGPMTGRGLGWCGTGANPRFYGRWRGFAGGAGWGFGRGFRRLGARPWGWAGFPPPAAGFWGPQEELDYLRRYAENLEASLEAVKEEIRALERESETPSQSQT